MLNKKQQDFCKYVAHGETAHQACIKAGYTQSYAKNFSHKLLEKYWNEIEILKLKVQEILEKKFNYDILTSFQKLNEIQTLALQPNAKGEFFNLSAALKAEELKGKMYGLYEKDNNQKAINLEPIEVQILK